MKTIFAITATLMMLLGGWLSCNNLDGGVSEKKFDRTHDSLKKEIARLKANQKYLKKNQDTIRINQVQIKDNQKKIQSTQEILTANQDSIKRGQQAIYEHITKRSVNPQKSDGSYLENLIKFLK